MRLESERRINIRGKEIGGKYPFACLPLVAKDKDSLLEQANYIASLKPDMLEWRADSFDEIENINSVIVTLGELRKVIGNIILMFTLRCAWEGGAKDIPQEIRKNVILEVLKTKQADIIDFEISNGNELVSEVKKAVDKYDGILLLSYHDFQKTKDEQFIINKIKEAYDLGGDIAKVAVMPQNFQDVLTLLSATMKARLEHVNIPLVTVSMGGIGAISRIAGGIFGSDITFAIGKEISGPGQIPIKNLKYAWEALSLQ